ncbi:MAG: bifunctional nuclease family protein [Gemmatimonadetes bacterium]|nr:bifunctional nuclease family protein [Gemmatimonadota bacterium]MYA64139.1 bifunctional nuclease family protein [Gemmatimonadota bacterium]MYB99786.1 bifunctional nuclease family protein [Gemmatimonadota bacterium]MYH53657.1 bifunctional nuclease family protein [Gemmatimonadota bacterium]MYI47096.1 bifunctional nuclease family protein [Gemmatimonadota bacterium]
MIEVNVKSLAFDRTSNTPVVILKEVGTERILPIWIGPGEASAIAMHLGGVAFQRPLTHDLLVSVMGGMGGTLKRVLITRVENSTYFAELIIDRDGEVISVDARPSDSIAIALRMEARIFADDSLLEQGTLVVEVADTEEGEGVDHDEDPMSAEALEEHLRGLRPEDLGRFDR